MSTSAATIRSVDDQRHSDSGLYGRYVRSHPRDVTSPWHHGAPTEWLPRRWRNRVAVVVTDNKNRARIRVHVSFNRTDWCVGVTFQVCNRHIDVIGCVVDVDTRNGYKRSGATAKHTHCTHERHSSDVSICGYRSTEHIQPMAMWVTGYRTFNICTCTCMYVVHVHVHVLENAEIW